ncbi:MAG: myo-inositol 2-dehydrogenase [Candidatus Methanoperedens nitroreducens]|uniref:Myo-inositol 2-dehydrogenase n=1 Tax=Candidatus Methanoperedens nitratireducens TaxID=1392998 RepID=A0A0P8AE77_9EURY|nr:UDP-N-acetylglucosamine 3-dehydrogenase [Candidatus Methanoperedens sp. BLZ2]KAB2948330.1 MAG: Gfo/Idh/MocA family oxidoreductase [Candidatus Methanoperedens sp.]KPQ42521.1 MAG: myo-inositol 2-dehydrogenase [Candidatus Methanoperedens sp. BLZ1]MBZ0176472.1 Gfo/Idh/MocA family oxidoreductase [Candidatus Methanoperedens nitroreducens]CAG1001478.1 myo-inositol 2-dehydrogenase / D-chiro-inositol 1-dehydrogenase [Methanosarcinales archaeon]MCX9076463.1 UDP-N-acetylglucosamine 3-dehydrogenase [Ca
MKVAVIGGGAMGQHHIRIYREMKDVELVGICDTDRDRAISLAKTNNTTPYFDHNELLKQDLDAVSVVVPTTFHSRVALDVINSGTHLLVEKPIADTLKNADTMINAAHDAKVKLMVGHIERFNPAVSKLKEIVDSGMLGKIVSISSRRVGPFNPRIRDVGIIMDLGVHDIDVISYLYGRKINEVYTIAGKDIHSFEDHASILLRCDTNLSGMVETNWLTPHKIRNLTAIGLKGVAYLDYIKQAVELHDEAWVRTAKVEPKEPLKNELEHFIKSVRDNTAVISNGETSRHALEVAMAAIESYEQKKAIGIAEK